MEELDHGNKIAVIGLGCHLPNADSPDAFWQNLRTNTDNRVHYTAEDLVERGVPQGLIDNPDYIATGIPLNDYDAFDHDFFGISHREAALMDPQHHHFLECCWEALECAGYPQIDTGEVGVFGGSGHNIYMLYNLLTNKEIMADAGLLYLRHLSNDKDFLTTRVSYCLDLKGPSINIQTACSTSLVAIHTACQALLNGECDMALAGGVTIEVPHRQGYMYRSGEILSPEGICRAFDEHSNGTMFGSGAGAVLLKPLADAEDDGDPIFAVILGSAINNDGGSKAGYMAPSVDGQARVISEALAIADVDAESIVYVETHGTGTAIGDPMEVGALTQVYVAETEQTNYCTLSSVKPNIGHLDTAAGVASFIKAVQALRHGEIPNLLNFRAPNPECGFEGSPFRVSGEWQEWPQLDTPRRAAVTSLGVGGTNAHVILEQAPASTQPTPVQSNESSVICLSARSSQELQHAANRLAGFFEENPDVTLAEIASTLVFGRKAFPFRQTLLAKDITELKQKLREPLEVLGPINNKRKLAFSFAGGGAQRVGMAAKLAEQNTTFRQCMDECLGFLPEELSVTLRALLLAPVTNSELEEKFRLPSLSVPGIYIAQYATLRVLTEDYGLQPDAMIGHSLGDYAPATLAGVFTVEDAVELVALRGRLIESIENAAMTSVLAAAEDVEDLRAMGIEIASINGPGLCVLSGSVQDIEKAENACAARNIQTKRVPFGSAAHCSLLDPVLGEYQARLEKANLGAPNLQIICNETGNWLTDEQATSPEYWAQHLRRTVQFVRGVNALKTEAEYTFLEVGPGATLTGFISACEDGNSSTQLTTLHHPQQLPADADYLREAVSRVWAAGVEVDWQLSFQLQSQKIKPLPTYPELPRVCRRLQHLRGLEYEHDKTIFPRG